MIVHSNLEKPVGVDISAAYLRFLKIANKLKIKISKISSTVLRIGTKIMCANFRENQRKN